MELMLKWFIKKEQYTTKPNQIKISQHKFISISGELSANTWIDFYYYCSTTITAATPLFDNIAK